MQKMALKFPGKYGKRLFNSFFKEGEVDNREVVIKQVTTKSELKAFIDFNNKLYKGHPYHVPVLLEDEIALLSRHINPAFDFCEAAYFLAYRGEEIVGRIGGIINHKANKIWNQNHARFGFVDFIDDHEVSAQLFKTVEQWALQKGCDAIHGPMGFTDEDKQGMLIEGFDQLGTMITIYNYPYYPTHLHRLGYVKDIDWVEFKIYIPKDIPDKHLRLGQIVRHKYGLRVAKFSSRKEVMPYAIPLFRLLNETYKHLYGFAELSERQIEHYVKQYIPMINLDLCSFIIREEDDELVGFGLTMPSMSRALQKSGGKYFPFGFVHLLQALKSKTPEVVDLLLIGVAPEYQNLGVNALIFEDLIPTMNTYQVKYVESNPELETNMSVMLQWNYFKKVRHKLRRAYIKQLTPPAEHERKE